LADYRDHFQQIRAEGANVAAVSVDAPPASRDLRERLSLPFPILCDTERRVLREWDLYNAREKGGIAKPAVLVIDRGRIVRYSALDRVAKRIPPDDILRVLQNAVQASPPPSKLYIPSLSDCVLAVRNGIRALRTRKKR
jgi:peroxiredoxin